jgi:NDP-4-keto-2,6-dideoxyhexose 3-C-methyltransferase
VFDEISRCSICRNSELVPVLDLGVQALTGTFPRSREQPVGRGPLELVKCHSSENASVCGLVQLHHAYSSSDLYGVNYGYRSSLNAAMVAHLAATAASLAKSAGLTEDDLVVDIGSNDGTLLSLYEPAGATLIGIDPTAKKFRAFYRPDIKVIEDFFSADAVLELSQGRRARIVTSIAMFYDLRDPMAFMSEVHRILDDEGLWHFEQSYLPLMLSANAYDTVCHEHLQYYSLRQIKWMTDRCGFKIVDVVTNAVNGGSFAVTVARQESKRAEATDEIERMLADEDSAGIDRLDTYTRFRRHVEEHRNEIRALFAGWSGSGIRAVGYGASTKGNVILQYCDLSPHELPVIGDVNPDKFGSFTPGSLIPIVSEADARSLKPDVLVVFPWHFRDFVVRKEASFVRDGGKLLFPLPSLELIGS